MLRPLLAALVGLALLAAPARAAETRISHGLSLFGELKYGKGFKHFDYVNAGAPKGGTATAGGHRRLR